MNKFDGKEFTKEKNLWDVFRLTNRITISKFHFFIIFFSACLLILNSVFFDKNISHPLNDLRSWASIGFNFTITTLGSLIAGFTIFATLSKPQMFLAMMGHINKETGMPTLKYNFMAFMKVFISFIFFSFLYLFIMMFGQNNGLAASLVSFLPYALIIKKYLVITVYVITGCSLIYLLLTLKTFIYNIYIIIMNSIRWESISSQDIQKNEESKD